MITETPKPLVKFFQGEPEALGTTQIFIGIFLFTFGLTLTIIYDDYGYGSTMLPLVYTGMTYWSGLLYIVSGSLSVAASFKPTLGKVKSSLVLNIISSIAAAFAIIILVITLDGSSYSGDIYCACFRPLNNLNQTCHGEFDKKITTDGLLSFMLLLTMLMFCITISTSAFACKTVCRTSYSEVNIILYQTNVVNASGTMTEAASVSISPLPYSHHGSILE
ncbi:membrane-spanning 4-domains subfamily A member 4A-like [Gastrophryne carolinensis]